MQGPSLPGSIFYPINGEMTQHSPLVIYIILTPLSSSHVMHVHVLQVYLSVCTSISQHNLVLLFVVVTKNEWQ